MKKLYLVDVSSMFFRAFFALPPLSNDKGMPTNALYGFLSMTIKLLREIKPDYIAFCFDTKEPSFRHEIYVDYKANRDEMPSDLIPQVPYVKKLSEVLGVPILEKAGFEADDIIGALTHQGVAAGMDVVIVSGDKDFAQLIGPRVQMYDTMKDVRYDVEGVVAKWGVRPDQMIDYLALVGDSSDNVPGVKGIGPKGAQKLLSEFKTLAGVYENLDKITGKAMKANLETYRDNAFLSQRLVTILKEVPLDTTLENLRMRPIEKDKLRELLLELGFKTFARNLTEDKPASESSEPAAVVEKSKSKSEPPRRTQGPRVVAGSVEVTERRMTLSELDRSLEAYSPIWAILDERGLYLGFEKGSTAEVWLVDGEPLAIGEILSRKQVEWQGFDLKEVWHLVQAKNPTAIWDSLLAAYVMRAGSVDGLVECYALYCHRPLPDLLTPAELFRSHLELRNALQAELKERGGASVLEKLELPLIPVLYAMESRGVLLDVDELSGQSKLLDVDLHALEKQIHEFAGGPFNIASPKQLGQILFGKMGLTPGKKKKTGFSTDSDVLEKLRKEHAIADCLLEYRELAKLKSTYVDALPTLVRASDGRIHTHFRQAATTTGRLSSINPNLQNIPIRTERGRLVRKAFVAAPGLKLIAADYSQIELRILAHITEDEALCRAFAEDVDIHAATASEVFGLPLKDVTPELRRRAKAVNFGIAYGQGAFGLAEQLGISRGESTEIIGRYFNRFKRVKEYMESIVKVAKDQGYVESLFGRRRYLDELKSNSPMVRKFGERAAINAPIQGTASDLVKLAMISLHQDLSVPMLLQVHDELLFEADGFQIDHELPRIKSGMEQVHTLKVPLKVNMATGVNWEDAHS